MAACFGVDPLASVATRFFDLNLKFFSVFLFFVVASYWERNICNLAHPLAISCAFQLRPLFLLAGACIITISHNTDRTNRRSSLMLVFVDSLEPLNE